MLHRRRGFGFTLIELLIVIAIIGILIASIALAVTAAKEYSYSVKCASQMKQLSQAFQVFHEKHGEYPPYNSVYPTVNAGNQVYGSWFVHVMPYTEYAHIYMKIRQDNATYGNSGNPVGGGTLITPAVPDQYDYTGCTWVPNTGGATTNGNGYTISGNATGGSWNPAPKLVKKGTPAVYGPPGAPKTAYGIWDPDVRKAVFPLLLCPSDPSQGIQSSEGLVYKNTSNPWGATNYLANWNVITNGNATSGYSAPSGRKDNVRDGLGNTILLGEAYSWCEGRGRTALVAWHEKGPSPTSGGVHNFGLTIALNGSTIAIGGTSIGPVTATRGLPNPNQQWNLNFGFQIQPSDFKTGTAGCNFLTSQSPHRNMNITLADGSTRTISAKLDLTNWMYLMLPEDGQTPDF